MILLNVSFGIFAFLPPGWLFMALVILGEAFLMSMYLIRKMHNKRIYLSALASNLVSGVVGIVISMALNGGWWLVVWFPWVTSHEVNIHKSRELWGFVLYYLGALILSVLIELMINYAILRKEYTFKNTLNATLIANAYSYTLGALLLLVLLIL